MNKKSHTPLFHSYIDDLFKKHAGHVEKLWTSVNETNWLKLVVAFYCLVETKRVWASYNDSRTAYSHEISLKLARSLNKHFIKLTSSEVSGSHQEKKDHCLCHPFHGHSLSVIGYETPQSR